MSFLLCQSCADQEGPKTPGKSQSYRATYQYWSGSHGNHKATKPEFNVGPPFAVSKTPFNHWWDDGGLLLVIFGSFLPSFTTKKTLSELDPL